MNDRVIIEEACRLVSEGVCVTLPVNGQSMLPFIIGGKESVILQKPIDLQVGHVVLAWADGTEHCQLSDGRALATHVVDSEGRKHDLYSKWRMRGVSLWNFLHPLRRYILGIYRRIK